ncbi:CRISPR-associated protein Cas5 [Caulobacter sp. FWC2]|uniref:CRISPR-associated protein Cas5 n=1 Tax=Caulobacter sp. FWC2 TaxID=69664 RepID=UPI0013042C06
MRRASWARRATAKLTRSSASIPSRSTMAGFIASGGWPSGSFSSEIRSMAGVLAKSRAARHRDAHPWRPVQSHPHKDGSR